MYIRPIIQKFLQYVDNGTLDINSLYYSNVRLCIYYSTHSSEIRKELKSMNIKVRGKIPKDYINNEQNKQFLIRCVNKYYRDTVNLSDMRKNHRWLYNTLSSFDPPEKVLTELGYTVVYNRKSTLEVLIEEIENNIKDGIIYAPPALWGKINHRAKKEGLTVKEYIKTLGYTEIHWRR